MCLALARRTNSSETPPAGTTPDGRSVGAICTTAPVIADIACLAKLRASDAHPQIQNSVMDPLARFAPADPAAKQLARIDMPEQAPGRAAVISQMAPQPEIYQMVRTPFVWRGGRASIAAS